MPRHLILRGDSRRLPLSDASIHCCVTSPPYYGLRDYGPERHTSEVGGSHTDSADYVKRLVVIFREVRRVLRRDGTLWLNLGDTFNAYNGGRGKSHSISGHTDTALPRLTKGSGLTDPTKKNKELLGIPWRVALALSDDGWYLRQDIIWHKPNAMPESVRDRMTAAHEYIFLLAKSDRYYCDDNELKESAVSRHSSGIGYKRAHRLTYQDVHGPRGNDRQWTPTVSRRLRSVWSINTRHGYGGHRGTFPLTLTERCVRAGCPRDGIVLDPFAGSFTVAAAAHAADRNSVGIDLYQNYCELGRARILDMPP